MRSSIAWCALIALMLGLCGCKSDGGSAPSWSNPFAKVMPTKPEGPEKPSLAATPTPPKAGFATSADDKPLSTARTGGTSSYDMKAGYNAPATSGSSRYGSNLGYGTPGASTSSGTGGAYMAPQTSRYDGGASGTRPAGPSYGDAGSSGGRASAGYDRSSNMGTSPASRYAGDPRYAPSGVSAGGVSDPFAAAGRYGDAGRYSDPSSAGRSTDLGSAGRYSATNYTRPWDNSTAAGGPVGAVAPPSAAGYGLGTGAGNYAPSSPSYRAADSSYRPGDTGYRPGDTGYRPGDNGYAPQNTPRYESPAPPYTTPGVGTDRNGDFRPGTTSRYAPRQSLLPDVPTGASGAPVAGTGADVGTAEPDSGFAPAGFTSPTKAGW